MRLFVAINIPTGLRQKLYDSCNQLRESNHLPLRWVSTAEELHVTVKFLGDVDENRVDEIGAALQEAVSEIPQFPMTVGSGVGCFPDMRQPRVVWAGCHASDVLKWLASQVNTKLVPFGFEEEDRFSPHITLARSKKFAQAKQFKSLKSDLAGLPFVPTEVMVSTIDLMLSHSMEKGRKDDQQERYTVLKTASLSPTVSLAEFVVPHIPVVVRKPRPARGRKPSSKGEKEDVPSTADATDSKMVADSNPKPKVDEKTEAASRSQSPSAYPKVSVTSHDKLLTMVSDPQMQISLAGVGLAHNFTADVIAGLDLDMKPTRVIEPTIEDLVSDVMNPRLGVYPPSGSHSFIPSSMGVFAEDVRRKKRLHQDKQQQQQKSVSEAVDSLAQQKQTRLPPVATMEQEDEEGWETSFSGIAGEATTVTISELDFEEILDEEEPETMEEALARAKKRDEEKQAKKKK